MPPQSTLVRLYLKFFLGTIAVWLVMLLGTAIVLAGTPGAPTELVLIICGGAIVSLLWGAAWFLALTHEQSSPAHADGTVTAEVRGGDATAAPGTTEARPQAPILFLVGTALIWVALIVATAITIRDTPHFVAEMVLILGAGAVWSILFVPSILAMTSASRIPASGPIT
jgi:hypothetical protein